MIAKLGNRPLLAALLTVLVLVSAAGTYLRRDALIARLAARRDLVGRARLAARFPDSPSALYYYGLSLLLAGETDLARERLARAAELEQSPRVMGALARAAYASGDTEYGAKLARVVLSEDPDEAQALWTRALDFQAHSNPGRAAEVYRRITEVTPQDAEAWYRLGACAAAHNQLIAGTEALRRAAALRPDDPTIINELAMALLRQGQAPEAEALARESLALDAERAATCYLLGRVLVARGNSEEAAKHLGEALRLAPGYALAHHELGKALARDRRWEEASKELEAALAADPDLRQARYELATVLRHLGRTEEAAQQAARYELEARCAQREAVIRDRLYAADEKAPLYFELARVRTKWGHLYDAYEAYGIGLQHDPHNMEAQREMAELARRLAGPAGREQPVGRP